MDYVYKPPTDAPWESIEDIAVRSRLQKFVKGLREGQCTPSIVNMVLKDFVAPEWRARVFAEAGVPDPCKPDGEGGEGLALGDEDVMTEEDDELLGGPYTMPGASPPTKAKVPKEKDPLSARLLDDQADLFPSAPKQKDDDEAEMFTPTAADASKKKKQKKEKKKKKENKPPMQLQEREIKDVPLQTPAGAGYGAVTDVTQGDSGRGRTKQEYSPATDMYHVGLYADNSTFAGEPLWALFLLAVLTNLDIGMVLPSLFSVMDVQYSALAYGATVGAFGVGQLLFGPVARVWGERPIREVLLVTSLLSAAGNWIYMLSGKQDTWEFFVLGRIVAGMGSSYILIAGLSITRLSPRGSPQRKRLNWFRILSLSSRLFGALLGLLLVDVMPSTPYIVTVGSRTVVIDASNGGICILACLFSLMFLIQAFNFGCASNRRPSEYGFLDAEGDDVEGGSIEGTPSSTHHPGNPYSGLWCAIFYGCSMSAFWITSAMIFPFVAGKYGWGLREQYVLAVVALAASWLAGVLQPFVQRFVGTPAYAQGPTPNFTPDKGETASALAISSGLCIGMTIGTPSSNRQTAKLGLALILCGSLALFAFYDDTVYQHQMYVALCCLVAGQTLVLGMVVQVVNDHRMTSTSSMFPGSLLSLPKRNPLLGVLLVIGGLSQALAPVLGSLLIGDTADVTTGFETVRVIVLGLGLVALFAHGLGAPEPL